jgi:putative intracellular protease/amidase
MSPLSVSVVMLAVGMALAAEPAAAAGAQRPAAAAVPARGAEAPVVPKVLLVVSSEGRLDAKGEVVRPGFEMDEFAQAWLVLRANGVQVDVASPAGGAVVADRYSRQDDTIQAMERDPDALAALAATRRLQDVPVGEHAAVFVMGGKGAMFDLPRDPALARLMAALHARGGVLAAVCHGSAALLAVEGEGGRALVQGRRLTGFTDEEEATFGKRWAQEYPFWIERRARELGAQWEEAAMMMPKLVVDDRLITGQNPFSTPMVADAVLRALGRTPQPRQPFREEASLQLVQQWLAGERAGAAALLAAEPHRYKADLIAMLGHYQHEAATDEAARRAAVSVMELAAPHFKHPRFRLSLAKAHAALGAPQRSRELLQLVAGSDHSDAKARSEALELLARQPG